MNEPRQQIQPTDVPGLTDEAGRSHASQRESSPSQQGAPQPYPDNRVLSFLFNTQVPVGKYIIRAGVLSLVPSLVISLVLAVVGVGNEETLPDFGQDQDFGPMFLFVNVVVLAPVVETLLLGVGLRLISFVVSNLLGQALLSSVLWALLHSAAALAWGPVVLWPFFVFSCAYLAWRRVSWWHAMGVACGIHMFQNFLPGLLLVFS